MIAQMIHTSLGIEIYDMIKVVRRTTKMTEVVKQFPYKERLQYLGPFSLKKKKKRRHHGGIQRQCG